ncbi:MAG TPA: DapH/DapD/GlmU-related protein [Casimicrobiaceae bacterium]|nr:DapH/DapD/GlmU-related protein [Casimicrobiaceae bacterium]
MTFARMLVAPTTARSVSERLGEAALIGNPDRRVRAIGALSVLADDALAFCDAARAAERLAETNATVVIVPRSVAAALRDDKTLIAVTDVRSAFIDTVAWLCPDSARPADPPPGVDRGAAIDEGATIAPSACIGANVVIGARTRIGPGTVVYSDTEIGRDCIVGANASIGFVGLAYHDRADGRRSFFPHLAGVRIGDRVDIGAMSCICRGMLSHTSIGDDAKLGSLVYVSHGVVLGARAWISAGTAIAGHAAVGEDALLGIGAVVVDNVAIGTEAMVAGGSVVIRHANAGARLHGVPAHEVPAMRRFGPTPRE